jgi:uncharacterized protein YabE (DUF348 family)/3D (Asp-Asp-Asp) domain-containing protein
MEILKKYGKPAAIVLIGLGLLLALYAWYVSPKAFTAEIWMAGAQNPTQITVSDLIAANWLQEAGVRLYPGDSIIYSGVKIAPDFRLPVGQGQSLVYRLALPVTVNSPQGQYTFYTSAPTLGQALWEQGISLSASDTVSLPLETPIDQALAIEIYTAKSLTIQIGASALEVSSAAATVGEALADAGVALQELDYSRPAEDQPLPEDGVIQVVRVREETLLEESAIAYSEERVGDTDMYLGEEEVRQTGVNGVQVSNVRVRYENDEEVSRTVEQEWVSVAPINQIIAYGTTANIQQSADNECFVDYYLAKEVYITSYHDTGQTMASGDWPYYGAIAVSPDWYSILYGSSICVPGYGVGTVLDVCPGCVGKDWIDVFIPTESYVSWSKTLTVYFMTPIPDGFSGDLP